jgi:hypothetical protein
MVHVDDLNIVENDEIMLVFPTEIHRWYVCDMRLFKKRLLNK